MKLRTVFVLFVLVFASYSFAFGSAAKKDYAGINENETAKFVLIFWGDNESIELIIQKKPESWAVEIDKKYFVVDANTGDEYVSTPDGYRKATIVNVIITPYDNKDGYVILAARTKVGSGIAVYQERQFRLYVDINQDEINILQQVEEKEPSYNLSIIFVIVILVLSYIIYKYL
jgi:hypothetical protein